jgi:hypothetical protein
LRQPPVWHDEAALINNVLFKDFGDLLGPLYYSEACPPLFLALEKAIVFLLGTSPLALRLLPLAASCLSLVALVLLARRWLRPAALAWFALLFACSDRLLWHASEAKPYALDVLVATGVLALVTARPRFPDDAARHERCRLITLTALSPVLVFLSFPACFILGGTALTLLPEVRRRRSRVTWALYTLFGLVLVSAFLALYLTAVRAQKDERILACWADIFPDWHRPACVPGLLVQRLTEVCRYAAEPAGNVLAVFAFIGAVSWWRQRQRPLLGFLLWPVALNTVAFLLGAYPLGATRVVVYAAPAVLLLIAAGIPPALAFTGRWGRPGRVVLAALLLVPILHAAHILVRPWGRADSATPAAFILDHRQGDEPVIGTLWEHAYYFRALGANYRALMPGPNDPPSPPAAAALGVDGKPTDRPVRSLWLLGGRDPADQAVYLQQLRPAGAWRVATAHQFRDWTVLHIVRD